MDLAQRHSASTPTASTPTASTPTASAPAASVRVASAPTASASFAPTPSVAGTVVGTVADADPVGSDQHARHVKARDGGPKGFGGGRKEGYGGGEEGYGGRRKSLAEGWRSVLREPFRAATWRRFAYLLLALPVGILCVPIALVGGPAGRIQRGLARRLLGVEVAGPRRGARTGVLALAHAVVSLPLNLIALAVSGYFWTIVVMNLAYPLRPGGDPSDAWGGPTMAGAWAVHGIGGGVPFLLVTPWVMRGFTLIQARLVRGFLGADRTGLLKTTWLALVLALACALLSIPVIHQL